MKRFLLSVAALVSCALSVGVARAEDSWVGVFEHDRPGVGRAEVAGVEKSCNFHMMSRMGPDPRELAACTAAVSRLEARGAAAAPAILAALDRQATSYAARERLYQALAATRDPAVAAAMIDGMAKIAQGRVDDRTYEAEQMADVARSILRVDPAERAPWVQRDVTDPFARLTEAVVAWRVHQRDHAGKPAELVAAERTARARAEKDDPDAQRAYLAVRHLVEVDPREGLAAAEALAARFPETEGQRDAVRSSVASLLRVAGHRVRELERSEAAVKTPPAAPNSKLKQKRPAPALPAAGSKARS